MRWGKEEPVMHQGSEPVTDDRRCSTCKKWKDCSLFSGAKVTCDYCRNKKRKQSAESQIDRQQGCCKLEAENEGLRAANRKQNEAIIELRAQMEKLERSMRQQAETIRILRSGEPVIEGMSHPSSIPLTAGHEPVIATCNPMGGSDTTSSAAAVLQTFAIDLDLFDFQDLLGSGSGSASAGTGGSGAGTGADHHGFDSQEDFHSVLYGLTPFQDLQLRVMQLTASAWRGETHQLPNPWHVTACRCFPAKLEEVYQIWRGHSNIYGIVGSGILIFSPLVSHFSPLISTTEPYATGPSLITSFTPKYYESMTIFSGVFNLGNIMYCHIILMAVIAWTYKGKQWLSARHALAWRPIFNAGVIICNITVAVSFFRQHTEPKSQDLTMYAMMACIRPVITKIGMDTPAWLHVSLVFLQVAAAACVPTFRNPLYEAMPAIMPTLAALVFSLYMLEFMRRSAFLRALFAVQLAQDTTFAYLRTRRRTNDHANDLADVDPHLMTEDNNYIHY